MGMSLYLRVKQTSRGFRLENTSRTWAFIIVENFDFTHFEFKFVLNPVRFHWRNNLFGSWPRSAAFRLLSHNLIGEKLGLHPLVHIIFLVVCIVLTIHAIHLHVLRLDWSDSSNCLNFWTVWNLLSCILCRNCWYLIHLYQIKLFLFN